MTHKILITLSYIGIVVGVILSFWILRGGALCFMFSIACAHIAGNQKAEVHAGWTQETLFIILSLLSDLNKKLENVQAQVGFANPPEPKPAIDLQEARSSRSQRS